MNMNYQASLQQAGMSGNGISLNSLPKTEEPGIQQVAGELAPRVGSINQRLDRISAALRCLPPNPESKTASISQMSDITSSLAQAHGALFYAESTLADIERAIGI